MTIIPEQAEAVKLIFLFYATGNYGLRKLSPRLIAVDTQAFWETNSIPSPSAIFCKTQSTRGGTVVIRHNPWIIMEEKNGVS